MQKPTDPHVETLEEREAIPPADPAQVRPTVKPVATEEFPEKSSTSWFWYLALILLAIGVVAIVWVALT